jgi:VWFA-related protein
MKGLAAVGVLLFAGHAAAQAPPVFEAEVEAAYVDVFVTDGGRSLLGLSAADFELKDNGVRQDVELVAAETRPVRAAMVFDASSSLAGEKLAALRAAGAAFLDGLRPDDEAALVAFSNEIAWLSGPTRDKAEVRAALGRLQPQGATALFDALFAALALSDRGGRSLVVLFTDGEDNVSLLDAKQVGKVAERSNALVHVVGLRPPVRTPQNPEVTQQTALSRIAGDSGGRFWTPDSPQKLTAAFAAIAASMSERYVLRYAPRGVAREGWHALEVRSKRGRAEARRGYWVAERNRAAPGG